MKEKLKNQSGVSLIAAIFIIVILAFMGLMFLTLLTSTSFTSINELQSTRALYIADGGIEYILGNRTFPNYSLTTATNLGEGSFTVSTPTYLTADPGAAGTTINVQSTTGFPASGRIAIDSELINYTGTTAVSFTGATRGVGGTTAAAHSAVNAVYPATTVTPNPIVIADTTINAASTTGFIIPGVIKIGSEYIYCTGTTALSFTNCTRGYKGTTAAGYAVGSTIYQYIITSTGVVPAAGGNAQRVVSIGVDGSSGNIAFNRSNNSARNSVSSFNWNHNVSGSDRILIVGVSIRTLFSNPTVSSITYDGVPLTIIGSQNSGGFLNGVRVELWYLVAPNTGNNTIVVTLSGSANAVGGAVSLTGVDQTNPIDISGFNSGTSNAPTVTISATANNAWVVDTLACLDATATASAGQTEQWNSRAGTGASGGFWRVRGAGSTEGPVPAGNITMSWGLSSSVNWAIGAVAVRPAGGVTVLSWQEVFQ